MLHEADVTATNKPHRNSQHKTCAVATVNKQHLSTQQQGCSATNKQSNLLVTVFLPKLLFHESKITK